jgi:hypothetical protein
MDQIRRTRFVLAALLTAATLTAGCSTTPQTLPSNAVSTPVPTVSTSPTPTLPTTSAVPNGTGGSESGRRGSNNGSPAAAGGLPADWPADLPVPRGSIIGSTGSAGRWTVLILAAGSAAAVRQSTAALYTSAGFTAVSDSVLNKGNRQITLVVENRDHSATQTNLVIGVTTG